MDKSLKYLETFFEVRAKRHVLVNGLKVLLQSNPARKGLVGVQVWVGSGSLHESPHLGSGLAHFTEHMLFKGTKTRNFQDISREIQESGGSVNAYTTYDRTVYHVSGPSKGIETFVPVLADMIFSSTFPLEEFNKEKEVILREIAMYKDDMDDQLHRLLFETAYRIHPCRFPILGESELFKKNTRTRLLDFYKTHYVPSNITIVVVGDFVEKSVLVSLYAFFNKQMAFKRPIFLPLEPKQMGNRTAYKSGAYQLVKGCVAYKIPSLRHEHTFVLDFYAQLLGGGHSSLLWKELRDRRNLVHSIEASTWALDFKGLLYIQYTCNAGKREEVEKAIHQVIEQSLKNGFSNKELNKALHQNLVAVVDAQSHINGEAEHIGFAEVVIGDLAYYQNIFRKMKSLTGASLLSIGRQYLREDNCTRVAVGPKETAPLRERLPIMKEEEAEEFTYIPLDNNIDIAYQYSSLLPKVHIRFALPGGAFYERKDLRGISFLLSTLLTKDSYFGSAAEVASALESIGADWNSFCFDDFFGVSLELFPHSLETGMSVLKNALMNLRVNMQTLQNEKKAQIALLKEENDDPIAYGISLLRKRFFKDHVYAYAPLGDQKMLADISSQDVVQLQQKLFSQPWTFTISGNIEKTQLLKSLLWLKKIPRLGPKIIPPAQLEDWVPRLQSFEVKARKEQAILFHAYPTCSYSSEFYEISELILALFNGLSSVVFNRIREELGLAYYVRAQSTLGERGAMMFFYTGTEKRHLPSVQAIFNEELQRIREGRIDDRELNLAKTALKTQRRLRWQSLAYRTHLVMCNLLMKKPTNYFLKFETIVDALTIKDIELFAGIFLKEEYQTELILIP